LSIDNHLALHDSFKFEQFEQAEDILNAYTELEQLLYKDGNGKLAWECEDIPEKYLALIVRRWMELNNEKQLLKIPEQYLKNATQDIAFDRVNSARDLKSKLEIYAVHSFGESIQNIADQINNYLGMISMLLVAANKMYGAHTLFLDFQINMLLPVLMIYSACVRIYQIFSNSRSLTISNILELGFIFISLALTVISIIVDSNPLMIIGAGASIIQSLFEVFTVYQNYQDAPEGTDRKVAYKQQVVEQLKGLVQNIISLAFVLLLVSGNVGFAPVMVSISILILSDLAWQLTPEQTKKKVKSYCGFGKSNYGFFNSKIKETEKDEIKLNNNELKDNYECLESAIIL